MPADDDRVITYSIWRDPYDGQWIAEHRELGVTREIGHGSTPQEALEDAIKRAE